MELNETRTHSSSLSVSGNHSQREAYNQQTSKPMRFLQPSSWTRHFMISTSFWDTIYVMTVLQYVDPCISYHYIRTREEEIQLFICDVIASQKFGLLLQLAYYDKNDFKENIHVFTQTKLVLNKIMNLHSYLRKELQFLTPSKLYTSLWQSLTIWY